MTRPPLPLHCANANIKTILSSGNLPLVKYQILNCQGQDILVGRLKIETSTGSGHAFILRRYDTGAVSLTTMFRAAFPKADEQSEKDEMQWVKDNYDLSGNNGSSKDTSVTRLAGTWVNPELARELGKAYLLDELISIVVDARPDPNANYRRSGKGANTTPKPVSSADNHFPRAPSPTAVPNPSKRRKEASPAPAPPASPPPERRVLPRRSTRTKSPAPKPSAIPLAKTSSRKTIKREVKEEVATPGGSDETAVDEEAEGVEDVAGEQLRQQDIAEQKILIEDLKAKRNAAMKASDGQIDESEKPVVKRAREEEEEAIVRFNFKEPEIGERAIATNRRVEGYFEEPRRKSLAWGVAAFAFGLGAVTFLPNFL
ncbi:hypothetical protein EV361DRAFT_869755 [Lentinula raphanica]|nr:hypothetical protein C8R42DRAFT_593013 [Lentinula raphanica]KAJ3830201.1 hypothetical protein F5880DRAFT_1228049 [Lentinula raphanica]KAJ3969850.1 hypothetical protein EV361DRAFT_869755 [Lentinula raphanica]